MGKIDNAANGYGLDNEESGGWGGTDVLEEMTGLLGALGGLIGAIGGAGAGDDEPSTVGGGALGGSRVGSRYAGPPTMPDGEDLTTMVVVLAVGLGAATIVGGLVLGKLAGWW